MGVIIALAPHSWYGPWMNRQQILSRMSDEYSVLYSSGILNSWEVGGTRWNQKKLFPRITDTEEGLLVEEPGKFPVRIKSLPLIDCSVLKAMVWRWRRKLNWNSHTGGIAYIFGPDFRDYVDVIKAEIVVYHIYDNFEKFPDWTATQERNHAWMIENADVLIASSAPIARHIEYKYKRLPHTVENGVDFGSFSASVDSPVEFSQLSQPKILYTGNINRKVDLELVLGLAELEPSWHFFFVGKVSGLTGSDLDVFETMKQRGNIHFLGYKPLSELPAYVINSDVNIMNYKVDDSTWTQFGYPLKLNEYLAAGKPIVSSKLPAIENYGAVIRFADGLLQWQRQIKDCLNETDESLINKRRIIAERNSWFNKVSQIKDLIHGME